MFRKLLIVFASGVILTIVAFSAAWVIGGDKFRQDVNNGDFDWTIGSDDDGADSPQTTRNFTIQPGARLAMDVPVQLVFTKGDKAEMVVSGPQKLVDRLTWENGRLAMKGSWHGRKGLKVRITAPEIEGLDFDAPGDVTLTGLDQDSLTVNGNGALSLDASGKVRKLAVSTEGAGDLDFGKLQVQDATIRVDGAGNMTIGASGDVDVQINGIGNVTLVRKPANLRQVINGIGNVSHDYN
ncbi:MULTISPECIES: GIN domain-containing protein [Novosphingobium]|uniref:DUF2807 domain-containing protein n=1 Tax=Novosphingobium pentaromativorans TaxID=205844 RepID=A0A2W5NHX2_9SPHN|nr:MULTISPECIES: DUF2807 domain-containing protein [Novosphingobium]PZQ53081.1 MAG: DUF2807 domain-containing protein [Novosphingobium pentaromativorans]GFE75896.1 hypothetical protein NTCA1_35450 [Novosphingobium sp. TCA1]